MSRAETLILSATCGCALLSVLFYIVNGIYRGTLLHANMSGRIFKRRNFSEGHFKDMNLSESCFRGISFVRANLNGARCGKANFEKCNFTGTVVSNANLDGASLVQTNFTGADLNCSSLRYANFEGAILRDCNLCRAVLVDSYNLHLAKDYLQAWVGEDTVVPEGWRVDGAMLIPEWGGAIEEYLSEGVDAELAQVIFEEHKSTMCVSELREVIRSLSRAGVAS